MHLPRGRRNGTCFNNSAEKPEVRQLGNIHDIITFSEYFTLL